MTEEMSICFVSLPAYSYFFPDEKPGGGGSRQYYLLSRELANDFDVNFVVGDYGQPRTVTSDGVTLHRAYHPEKGSGVASQIRKTLQLADALRRADADIYIYCGAPHKAVVIDFIIRFFGEKWIYYVVADDNLGRHYRRHSRPVRQLFRRALGNAADIIVQTDYQAETLRSEFGCASSLIPCGYPPADGFTPYEDRSGFVWIGNINRDSKRPHCYLDAAEAVPNEEFVLVGPRDDDEAYYQRIADRAAEIPNVTFEGPIPSDEVHDYLRDPYALVNTSVTEGFPNTFLEAWRYGTPVVSLNVDPGRYVQFSGSTGGADGDFDRFVDLLGRVAADTDFRKTLGNTGKQQFQTQYSIKPVADRYRAVIRECV